MPDADTFPTFTSDGAVWVAPGLRNDVVEQGSITWREDREMLKIQIIDAYSYQREFSIGKFRRAGESIEDPKSYYWAVKAYRHPFRPGIEQQVSEGIAKRLMTRIIFLFEEHPTLLFNPTGYTEHQPPRLRVRHEGFVHFHDKLLEGYSPTVKLLP